eukprot:6563503-Pyramimonas_sp.AAC.1
MVLQLSRVSASACSARPRPSSSTECRAPQTAPWTRSGQADQQGPEPPALPYHPELPAPGAPGPGARPPGRAP